MKKFYIGLIVYAILIGLVFTVGDQSKDTPYEYSNDELSTMQLNQFFYDTIGRK